MKPKSFSAGKSSRIAVCIVGLLLAGAADGFAQAGQILLKVTKKEDTDYNYRYSSPGYRSTVGADKVHYRIEVVNGSPADVSNVVIRWAVLIKPGYGTQPRVIEGSRKTDLKRGQRYEFDTDIFQLGSVYRSNISGTSRFNRAEILGYAVEVIVDAKTVSSDIRPADTKMKIDALKSSKPPEPPKVHRF
jgi:hypothetical protein